MITFIIKLKMLVKYASKYTIKMTMSSDKINFATFCDELVISGFFLNIKIS